jgi:hypothetical protein
MDNTGTILHESDVSGMSVSLPSSVKLAEDVPYSWSESARTADGRKYSSSADFSVAPGSLRQRLAAIRPAASAALSDRAAYASWLEQLELRDEARPIWRALAAERPDDERLQTLARD